MKNLMLSVVFVLSCTMIFAQTPVANAGSDTLFCGFQGQLHAVITEGTGIWTSTLPEHITIVDPEDPETEVISDFYTSMDPEHLYIKMIWTVTLGEETDSDTVKVQFIRIPSNEIYYIPPKCFGEPALLYAAEDTVQQYTWDFYGGIIDSVTPDNDMGGTYENFVYWTDEEETHTVSLISTNYWGCQSPINIDTIQETAIPDFGVTIALDTCALSRGALIFNDTILTHEFFWLDTTVGPPSGTPITSVYNIPQGEYDIRVTYLTPNSPYYAYYMATFGTASCIDTINVIVEPTMLIDAEAFVSADIQIDDLFVPASVIFVNTTEDYEFNYNCIWEFGDEVSDTNCNMFTEHIYNTSGCFNPYLVIEVENMPECRDTAYIEPCINIQGDGSSGLFNVESDYLIYPNPVREFFSIESAHNKILNITIVDALGNEALHIIEYQDDTISIKGLNHGLYSLIITTEEGIICKKFIILDS